MNFYKNWRFWVPLVGIALWIHVPIKRYNEKQFFNDYQFGLKANEFRKANNIPVLADYLEPYLLREGFLDTRWSTQKSTSKKRLLVHNWKIIEVSEQRSWEKEFDCFKHYINDTTDFRLNISTYISPDSIYSTGILTQIDKRNEKFNDFTSDKYPKHKEIKLNTFQLDSIRDIWGI